MEFKHISVLFDETLDGLSIKPCGIYVDGTLGGGGHTGGILRHESSVSVIGIDQDEEAISAAKEKLQEFSDRVRFINSNFKEIKRILSDLNIKKIDGAVLDLGVSSYQLDNADRGFSYMHDAPLDMRMDKRREKNAYSVINEYSKDELSRIFYEYGEEKWSKRVAEFICDRRSIAPIETTNELVEIIKAAIPQKARLDGGHPAKRIFQAVRIEVNGELALLEQAIRDFSDVLKSGGRLAVITFHSLEDRIVKNVFQDLASGCRCPKDFPVCVCGGEPTVKIITKKPIVPTKEEMENNTRSKSAKLRIIEKI
ncbi:MAG: 16S rRNA (cytosine(1402)-N(4))-methyltransferase RsmH [Clostridia bacterium]|nr:16S rRNA (cytosine(1402)-N(4))-methyltransferase RsmH [Clostridia bacterium]